MIRVLITGASGFIGTHCLRRLRTETCEIHAVNRAGQGEGGDRVKWHAADLRDPVQAEALVATIRPTHLLHAAWVATPRVYSSSPENVDWLKASIALAWAFGKCGGTRFVGVGSSAEYEPGDGPCIEDETPVRPATIYGKCKAACWFGVQAAAQYHKFSAAWGRLFLVYGPGDPAQRLIPTVLASFREKKLIPMTHGAQLRDFVYAPDAADLLVRLLLSEAIGAFNVGTGNASTVRSVVSYLAERTGNSGLLQFGALEASEVDAAFLVANMAKVSEQLRWTARTDIWTGLDAVLRDSCP